MKLMIDRFYEFLSRPMYKGARIALFLLVFFLGASLTKPLWRISMTAPQYPGGLTMDIYAFKLEGGREGVDLHEINTLNHYIGMQKIDRHSLADLDWLPFALGFLIIMSLRVAAIGTVRDLVDVFVLTSYVSLFAFGRYVFRLYSFGHDLSPDAPVKVKPFMPVIIGHKTVANFETYAYPQLGSYLLGVFVVGLFGLLVWHLVSGRRQATRTPSTTAAA